MAAPINPINDPSNVIMSSSCLYDLFDSLAQRHQYSGDCCSVGGALSPPFENLVRASAKLPQIHHVGLHCIWIRCVDAVFGEPHHRCALRTVQRIVFFRSSFIILFLIFVLGRLPPV